MSLVITRGTPSARALRLKERLLESPYEIDIERARYYTRIWKEMESAPPCMKTARALEATLRHMGIRIDEDEQLVGVKTAKPLAGVIPVERGEFNTQLEIDLDGLLSRKRQPFHITAEERRELEREILPYWRKRTIRDHKIKLWKEQGLYDRPFMGPIALHRLIKGMGARSAAKVARLTIGGDWKKLLKVPQMLQALAGLRPNLALTVFDVQGHLVPGHKRVLEMGFEGIAAKAAAELAALKPGDSEYAHRKDFLESVQVAAKAVCDYSERYATLAEELAAGASAERKAELLAIAERCRKVPAKPPEGFMEALQSLWMTEVVLCISYGMAEILSPGRVDYYLQPYYASDLAAGRITRRQALEAVEEYLVKLGTFLILLLDVAKDTASEMAVGSNTFTIGGLDREGNDATTEMTHIFLEAHENMRALANNCCIRISSKTPPDFLTKACETHRYTSGHAFFNDDVIVPELMADGFSQEDSWDYSIVGCVEPTSTGNAFACTAGNDVSLAGVLEMALTEGRMLFSGHRVGARTPDPRGFTNFQQMQDTFREQLAYNVKKLVDAVEALDRVHAEAFPSPLISSTLEGCLESGTDMTRGGAHYNYGSITGRGLATVVNSLAAIRWAVFDKKLVGMDELIDAMRENFHGHESLRQELQHKAPKYGNDDPAADDLARWVTAILSEEIRKHPCGRGGFYRSAIFSYGVHVTDGMQLGATPDGRVGGDPVSNGISPANGTETNGPTAVLRSAALSAGSDLSNGTALNMRFSPALLATDEGVEKLAFLTEAYFALGGRHVQYNVVDSGILKDAQEHPEKYRDLVVRVSGYCAYFTDLGRSIQNDIIARTEFGKA